MKLETRLKNICFDIFFDNRNKEIGRSSHSLHFGLIFIDLSGGELPGGELPGGELPGGELS